MDVKEILERNDFRSCVIERLNIKDYSWIERVAFESLSLACDLEMKGKDSWTSSDIFIYSRCLDLVDLLKIDMQSYGITSENDRPLAALHIALAVDDKWLRETKVS